MVMLQRKKNRLTMGEWAAFYISKMGSFQLSTKGHNRSTNLSKIDSKSSDLF